MTQSRAPRPFRPARPARSWRRTLGALGGTLALVAAASACSSGSGSLEKPDLNVGIVAGIGAAPFQVGDQQGAFTQNGLTLNVQPFPTDAAAEAALAKGEIDVAFGDYSEFLNEGPENASPVAAKVQVIGEGYDAGSNTIGLVAAKGSPLTNATLTGTGGVASQISTGGLSVDVPDQASPEFLALSNWSIAEQQPLNLNTERISNSASGQSSSAATASAMISAVTSGQANVAVLQEPFLTEALETGTVAEIANLDSGNAVNMPIGGYFALGSTVQKDPNTIAAFQAGLAQSQALGVSRVDVESALTAEKVTHAVAATTAIGNYPTGIVAASLTNILSLMGSANIETAGLSAVTLTGGSAAF
jgi:NitT/TauT family transport system substrate-binding protein